MTVWLLASAGAAYLTYVAASYLDAKSGLPAWLCGVAGAALAAPLLLVVTRPLLAWRVAWVGAVVTGIAVQAHHRAPPTPALLRHRYQGTTPASSKNPPLGPPSGRVASRIAIAAPCSGVRIPRKPFRSVAT